MTRVAFPTDEHHPFADHRARNVALQIIQDFNPDIITAGSDALDFYKVSSFVKDPEQFNQSLQFEIDEWKKSQREWNDASPNASRYFIVGNHEARLRRYVNGKAPELASLASLQLPELLGFSELDLRMARNNEISVDGKLLVKHGSVVRKHSAYTARAELESEKYGINIFTGHTHRGGTHYATTRRGIVAAHEGFCLCSLNPMYLSNPNWQQGLLLGTVQQAGVQVESIPFFQKGQEVFGYWRDKEYKA